jgi:hypothetical protein
VTKDYRTGEPFDADRDWPAYFWPDPNFALANHVRYFDAPMGHASMLEYLSCVINEPPPLDRPPWEILVRATAWSLAACCALGPTS